MRYIAGICKSFGFKTAHLFSVTCHLRLAKSQWLASSRAHLLIVYIRFALMNRHYLPFTRRCWSSVAYNSLCVCVYGAYYQDFSTSTTTSIKCVIRANFYLFLGQKFTVSNEFHYFNCNASRTRYYAEETTMKKKTFLSDSISFCINIHLLKAILHSSFIILF